MRRAQRNHHGTDVHSRKWLTELEFGAADFFGQRLQAESIVWSAGRDFSVHTAAMTRKTVHRPVAIIVNDILQRFARIITGPIGQAIAIERHLPTLLRRGLFRFAAKWLRPTGPNLVKRRLIEIRWQEGVTSQFVVPTLRSFISLADQL